MLRVHNRSSKQTSAVSPASDNEEKGLIARALRRDHQAFERLYRRYVGRTFALCLRLTADPEQAETLTQDVFVRVWRKLGTFAGRGPFGAWLRRLTINVVLEHQRAGSREAQRFEPGPDRPPGERGGLEGITRPRPLAALDLERAIAALPSGARMAFVLHDVEGYTHREIAEMTGTAQGTMKAQAHRARMLLRRMLGDGGEVKEQ